MKQTKLFLLILGIFLFSISNKALGQVQLINSLKNFNQVQLINSLKKYDNEYITNRANFLKEFSGDTIIFCIRGEKFLSYFTKEIPDTIWQTQRLKKNPKEGKHFQLTYTYKPQLYGNKYCTPVEEINGKPFRVINAEETIQTGAFYTTETITNLKLEDLADNSIVIAKFPNYLRCEIPFTSTMRNQLARPLIGSKFYIKTSSQYSAKSEYTQATLQSCKMEFKLVNSTAYPASSKVEFKFTSTKGKDVPFKFSHMSSINSDADIITEEEYEKSYSIKSINSKIDTSILYSNVELPFNFGYIIGKTSTFAEIFQTIDPTKTFQSGRPTKYLSDIPIGIAGKINVRGRDYYKGIYQGKAFFINASSVTLKNDMKARVDSLSLMKKAQSDYFFNFSLYFWQKQTLDDAEANLAELESYAKYGIAIQKWGPYDESVYTDGTGMKFRFYNPTRKTIKYITIKYVGYNAVDDPVSSAGKTLMTSKCIGPIEPDTYASYQFEYVWFTDIVDYARIKSIIVQYTDGSTRTITKASNITFSDKLRDESDNDVDLSDLE